MILRKMSMDFTKDFEAKQFAIMESKKMIYERG